MRKAVVIVYCVRPLL